MAFNPGDALWVLPQPEKCSWSRKLDWYLNFQFTRSSFHQKPQLEAAFDEILRENELSPPTLAARTTAPLMVSTRSIMPLTQVVLLPFESSLKQWLDSVANIASGLQQTHVRLFLPSGIQEKDLEAVSNLPLPEHTSMVFESSEEQT